MKKIYFLIFLPFILLICAQVQFTGDFLSKAAGPSNWNDFNAWEIPLPDHSSINLLQKFKKAYPAGRVIMFANYTTVEFKKSCMEMGAYQFIDKKNYNKLLDSIA